MFLITDNKKSFRFFYLDVNSTRLDYLIRENLNIRCFYLYLDVVLEQLLFISRYILHVYVSLRRSENQLTISRRGTGGVGGLRVGCPAGRHSPDIRGRTTRGGRCGPVRPRVGEGRRRRWQEEADPTYLRTCACVRRVQVRATGLASCIRPKRMTRDETITFIKISYTYNVSYGDVILY